MRSASEEADASSMMSVASVELGRGECLGNAVLVALSQLLVVQHKPIDAPAEVSAIVAIVGRALRSHAVQAKGRAERGKRLSEVSITQADDFLPPP